MLSTCPDRDKPYEQIQIYEPMTNSKGDSHLVWPQDQSWEKPTEVLLLKMRLSSKHSAYCRIPTFKFSYLYWSILEGGIQKGRQSPNNLHLILAGLHDYFCSRLTFVTGFPWWWCCSAAKSCLTLCNPMDCSMPDFPVFHYLPELAQTHVHWVDDVIQPLHSLSPTSPHALNLFQHQCLFQWVSSSCQVAKVLELQLQHQSFQ